MYIKFLSNFTSIFNFNKTFLFFLLYFQIVVMESMEDCFRGAHGTDVDCTSWNLQCSPWHDSVDRASHGNGADIALRGNAVDGAPHGAMA